MLVKDCSHVKDLDDRGKSHLAMLYRRNLPRVRGKFRLNNLVSLRKKRSHLIATHVTVMCQLPDFWSKISSHLDRASTAHLTTCNGGCRLVSLIQTSLPLPNPRRHEVDLY